VRVLPNNLLRLPGGCGLLTAWVDANDAPRGDRFFIERLVLSIESHGRSAWADVPENRGDG
jgi:hypothetical protein